MYFKSLDMDKRKKSAPREKDVNIKDFLGWFIQAISIVEKNNSTRKQTAYVGEVFFLQCLLPSNPHEPPKSSLFDRRFIYCL